MGEAMHMPGQEVYGKSLSLPLNFEVNLNCSKNIVFKKGKIFFLKKYVHTFIFYFLLESVLVLGLPRNASISSKLSNLRACCCSSVSL